MGRILRSAAILVAALVLVLPAAAMAADPRHPGGVVTDDPSGHEDDGLGLNGAGISHVEAFLGSQAPATSAQRRARNVNLVGALKLDPFNVGVHGDVAAYKNLAFVGKWREACPGTGVDIIDISRPSAPVKLADTLDAQDTSMEDMEVIEIGGRPVLGTGLQDCHNIDPGPGKSGLELYDISNPRSPQLLSFFDVDQFGADVTGVHELDLTLTPDGRALALLTVPNLEVLTNPDGVGGDGVGDLLVVDITDPDITDPANPRLLGEFGVLDEPRLGIPVYVGSQRGSDARTYLHGVKANSEGTLVSLAYWDSGFINLDLSNPAQPVFLGRFAYRAGEEGNAHSAAFGRGSGLLVTADEDYTPFEFFYRSNAFAGTRPAVEAAFTPSIFDLPGRTMAGEVVHVGRGCPAGSIAPGSPEDPYLADPAGKIALIERGGCRFDNKIGRAKLAGATGVIVYNSEAGGEGLVLMGGENPVTLPDGTVVQIDIPAVFVQRSTGLLLRDGTPPVTVTSGFEFNGWGFMRVLDLKDPASPRQIATFKTPNTTNEAVALDGTWSIHNPEVRGSTVYASWYSDGVRVIDISNPGAPRELGFWQGAGAPADAPAVNIWSVVPHGDLLVASDRNFGLYILRQTP